MPTLHDWLHLAVIWTLDLSAFLANLVLIIAILLRTPAFLRSYSVFLLNNAIIDLASCAVSALGAVRVVETHEGAMLFVFLGPCSLISEDLCRVCQALHIDLVQQSTIVLLLSFAYRLYVIDDVNSTRSALSPLTIWLLCCVSLLLIPPQTIAHYLEQKSVDHALLIRLGLEQHTASSFAYFGSTRAIVVILITGILSPIVMIFIFIVRRKLLKRIEQSSPTRKYHHGRIARALTYQMMLPCGIAGGVSLWLLDATGIWSNEFSQRFMMISSSMFPLASPLINLAMLPPYRAILSCSRTTKIADPSITIA